MRIATILAGLLALLYLNTALVSGEGGPGTELVFRPFHGLVPIYGGGEEGAWQRAHPNEALPWWMTNSYSRLTYFDDTGKMPPLMAVYFWGYYATALGILSLCVLNLVRYTSRKSRTV